ncbi:acyl-CoA thioesterase [Pseudomonadota bacterium]
MNADKTAGVLSASIMVRIPFYDLDPAGFVWHGRYFKYFELARSSLLDSVGYNYLEMKESGFLWPIVDTQVRFLKPLTLHQEIRVSAQLAEWEYRLVFNYRVEDEQGQLCARAKTVQVPIDATTYEMQLGAPDLLMRRISQKLAAEDSSGA